MKKTDKAQIEDKKNFQVENKSPKKKKTPFELLEEYNLIGCFEGEENLSRDYKKLLTQSLSKGKLN